MKTTFTISKITLQILFQSFIFILAFSAIEAQTFYLKDIVLGNRHARTNTSFSYTTPWYYDYSIKKNRADSRGGDLELHVTLKAKPYCKKVYKVTWAFNKDINTVTCGEKIFVNVVNQPIAGDDCGWDWVFHNPSSFSLLNGASGMTQAEVRKDPKASYREYVFLHHPGHKVQGEPQFIDNKFTHLYHVEQLEITVCSRKDFAAIANGGNFHFNFDARGVSFDIDYMFSKEPTWSPRPTPKISLQNPIIQHNVRDAQGIYWMGIHVPGILQGHSGKQIQVVIRFVDANGNFLLGNPSDPRYIDASGYAATGSEIVSAVYNHFDLGALRIWMPYSALNLTYTGGRQAYNLNAFAEVYADGKMVGQSQMVPLRVNW